MQFVIVRRRVAMLSYITGDISQSSLNLYAKGKIVSVMSSPNLLGVI